jgi:hypothetical protein
MMRRMLVLSGLLAVSAAAFAQDPVQSAPAAAPKVGRAGPNRNEFRVGGFMHNAERSYEFTNSKGTEAGSIKGIEVLLRGTGIGLYVRSLSGEFGSQPQVISADARLLIFPPAFTIFGGVGKRALSSDLKTLIYDVTMLGVSSTLNIGGTGWRTHISANAVLAPDKSTGGAAAVKNSSTGLEGEAAIFYRLPKVPFFITVGYRTEVFTGKTVSGSGSSTTTLESPEEVRGIRIGGGIQFGGH